MIIYAPLKLEQDSAVAPRQGMNQADFYSQQPQQPQQPTTSDFVNAQLQRVKQRKALPNLTPGSRVQNVTAPSPNNFQNYYNQLATIKQIGEEQAATAQAQAAIAQIRAAQNLNQYNAANPRYSVPSNSSGGPGRIGSGVVGSIPSNPQANFRYAQNIAGNYGWSDPSQLAAWYKLGMKESGWRNTAQNPTSTAYGIGQFLDSTWRGYGIPKTSDPAQQVEAMARYIKARYGSPAAALAFHNSHNWY